MTGMTAQSPRAAASPLVDPGDPPAGRAHQLRARTPLLWGVAGAGAAGWCSDVTVLYVLHTYAHVTTAVAAACGFIVGAAVNFALNRWFFHAHRAPAHQQIWRYSVLFLANLAVVTALVPVLADSLGGLLRPGLRLLVAKVAVTAALLPGNAWAYRLWVFKA